MSYSLAITSGKGGAGKTSIATNLGIALAMKKQKVCLLDTDFGLANAHILLGMNPEKTIGDHLFGNSPLADVIIDTPSGLKLISGGSGVVEMLTIDLEKRAQIIRSTEGLAKDLDVLLVDVPAGANDGAIDMIGAADRVLVVLIGEPTSFADAYTLIKAASIEKNIRHFSILVNMSYSPAHARDTFERFQKITDRFLDVDLFFAGHMPISRQLRDSIVSRRPLMMASGESRESMMFRELATTVSKMPANTPAGLRFLGAKDMAKGG